MKNLFRLSSQSKKSNNQYAPPPGPPPPQNQSTVPHGQAGDYYGHQSPTSPVYNQNQYLPPSGPPPPSTNQAPTYGHQFQPGVEDPLAMLSRYDTVILVDDSGSMEMFWDETRDALIGVVEKAIQYDSDGIDLFFFNDPSNAINCNSPDQVRRVFRNVLPRRSTPTAASIKRVLDPYLTLLHQSKNGGPTIKPMNLIVLTDGEPDRGQDPEQVIVEIGRYLDSNRFPLNQLGISFVQIGNDSDATRHLIALDDGLKAKHKIRDFVDCTPYQASNNHPNVITADFILKALIGGVNRKIDHLRL
ncbi:hypothetical protein PSTG_04532 [Puccinia striiformis f. sp. tritici PST-78]|uniref:VWFA domain-containing protein n=1 Tax=Puccinia striiformis f. sp. tritici PST-78 TaxID=1165861 RepID=A0A0L0VSS1_9BASI|nr:hypothetical protein PSTG_04532 [Puccinia striiformis f. sp. tritici PST-78]